MEKRNASRRMLLSVLSIIICFSLLLGATYAWFSDSISSANNKITSGNLDVVLEYADDFSNWQEVDEQTEVFDKEALWEPGYMQMAYFRISNAGTLALRYNFSLLINKETKGINVYGDRFALSDHLTYAYIPDVAAAYESREDAVTAAETFGSSTANYTLDGSLLPGESRTIAVLIYMPTTVGNVANSKTGTDPATIYFGIMLNATQFTYESDAFDETYDEGSAYDYRLAFAPTTDGSAYVVTGLGTYADSVVRIPDTWNGKPVIGITSGAFNHCVGITAVELSASVTQIEGGAFRGCDNLASITVAAGNHSFKTENGMLYSADGTRLVWCPWASGTVELPDGVTTIASYAFYDRYEITRVVVPDTLKAVGVGAFAGCDKLTYNRYLNGYYLGNENNPYVVLIKLDSSATELVVHDSNKAIADDALQGCSNLQTVAFPEGITVIDTFTLQGCANVTVITVPITVNVIAPNAFEGLDKLEQVILPDSITSIGDGAFAGCEGLEKVTVPADATIGEDVFENCTSLKEVTFVSNTTSIPAGTFVGCSNLQNVSGLGVLTEVGDNAFAGCVELTGDLYISADAVVGENAFSGCTNDNLNIFVESSTGSVPSTWDENWNGGSTEVRVHYTNGWTSDSTHHWYACIESGCGYTGNRVAHTFDPSTRRCSVCNRQENIANQSYGLEIKNGQVVGIGECIETTVYLNMPVAANAFYQNSTVKKYILSSGVTSIGNNAFAADSDLGVLEYVVFTSEAVPVSMGSNVFAGNRNENFYVYVPQNAVDAYKAVSETTWQTALVAQNRIIGCSQAVLDSLCSMYTATASNVFSVSNNKISAFANRNARAPYLNQIPNTDPAQYYDLVLPTFINGQLITEFWAGNYQDYGTDFIDLRLNTLVIAGGIKKVSGHISDSVINTLIIGDEITEIPYQWLMSNRIDSLVLGKGVTTINGQAFGNSRVGAVYYRGTAEDWAKISIGNEYNYNTNFINATRYYYSETEPPLNAEGTAYDGNYWHYVNGEVTVWTYNAG